MRYRLVIHSRSDDVLPPTEDFDTAQTAFRRGRELQGPRIAAISIYRRTKRRSALAVRLAG